MTNQAKLLLSYIALIAVSHDGVDYAPGASLALTLPQAEPLLEAKAIELDRSNGGGDTDPELGETDRLNEILARTEIELSRSHESASDLNQQLLAERATNQDLAGQLESAQTAKASAQSEVAELQVKLSETLDALQASQAALASAAAAKPGKKT